MAYSTHLNNVAEVALYLCHLLVVCCSDDLLSHAFLKKSVKQTAMYKIEKYYEYIILCSKKLWRDLM